MIYAADAQCHKMFGDGIAVLTDDALLTIAFGIAYHAKAPRRYGFIRGQNKTIYT